VEEAPENGKESSHSANTKGMNECNMVIKASTQQYLHNSIYPAVTAYRS